MDLSNSVIIPREDFIEMQDVAFNQTPATPGERAASLVQTYLVMGAVAGAFAGATWSWVKAMDYLEEKNFKRQMAKLDRTTTSQK